MLLNSILHASSYLSLNNYYVQEIFLLIPIITIAAWLSSVLISQRLINFNKERNTCLMLVTVRLLSLNIASDKLAEKVRCLSLYGFYR